MCLRGAGGGIDRKRKRPGWRGGEGGGGGEGFSWEADPLLVLIWESGDPTGKHAAVSCHLCRHVIEHKVPAPPGTRGRRRGPNLREDQHGATSTMPALPSRSRTAVGTRGEALHRRRLGDFSPRRVFRGLCSFDGPITRHLVSLSKETSGSALGTT